MADVGAAGVAAAGVAATAPGAGRGDAGVAAEGAVGHGGIGELHATSTAQVKPAAPRLTHDRALTCITTPERPGRAWPGNIAAASKGCRQCLRFAPMAGRLAPCGGDSSHRCGGTGAA